MTAGELMKLLGTLPPDMKVVVRGYEDGYNDIMQLKAVKIKPDENAAWYMGEYKDSEEATLTTEGGIDAVELNGTNNNPKDDL